MTTKPERARGARTSPTYRHMDAHKVLSRDDHVFIEDMDQAMELFRKVTEVVEELGFHEVYENYSEHWEALPFKNEIETFKWKDPFTAIKVKVKFRVKDPRSDWKSSEDLLHVKIKVYGYVVRTRYPYWEPFEEPTLFQRSAIYRFLHRILDSILFRKEWERYEEEAQELALAVTTEMRELEGSLPAIGKSRREWYNPAEEGPT